MNQYFNRVPYVPRQCHTVTKLEQAHRLRVRVHVFFEASLNMGVYCPTQYFSNFEFEHHPRYALLELPLLVVPARQRVIS